MKYTKYELTLFVTEEMPHTFFGLMKFS